MIQGVNAFYMAGTVAWFGMLAAAVCNGALRERVLAPRLGAVALPLSGLIDAVIFTFITYVMLRWLGNWYTIHDLFILGFLWLLFTVGFELILERCFLRKSWDDIWKSYDLRSGNLWSALLFYIFLLPFLVSRLLINYH
jgi:membrane-associated HD superfamily phosphohydrolase